MKNKAGTGDREAPGRRWEATLLGLKQHLSRPEGWKEPPQEGLGVAGGKALRWEGASLFSGQEEGSMAGGEPPRAAGGQEVRLGLVCLGGTTPCGALSWGQRWRRAESSGGQHGSTLGRPLPHHFLSLQPAHLVGKEP